MIKLRAVALCLGALGVSLVSGCDDTPPTPPPTPAATPTPAARNLAPDAYLLSGPAVAASQRNARIALTAAESAAQWQISATELQTDGYQDGARVIFQQPKTGPVLPFVVVQSEVYFFATEQGADTYFNRDVQRSSDPANGAVSALPGLPAQNVDRISGFSETKPATSPGGPDQQAYIAVLRRGRAMVLLYAYGSVGTSDVQSFTTLLVAQEGMMAVPLAG